MTRQARAGERGSPCGKPSSWVKESIKPSGWWKKRRLELLYNNNNNNSKIYIFTMLATYTYLWGDGNVSLTLPADNHN
jgi:hypothetical protein